MRPFGTSAQRATLRQRAYDLLDAGTPLEKVAAHTGVSPQTVRRWKRERYRPPPAKSRRGPGRPPFLSKGQLARLQRELQKGAYAYGYAEEYWTTDRIAHVIWELFGVRYHSSGVWRLLRRMGWSCQKPQRQALHRDDAAVEHWKRYTWPQIKKSPCAQRRPHFSR